MDGADEAYTGYEWRLTIFSSAIFFTGCAYCLYGQANGPGGEKSEVSYLSPTLAVCALTYSVFMMIAWIAFGEINPVNIASQNHKETFKTVSYWMAHFCWMLFTIFFNFQMLFQHKKQQCLDEQRQVLQKWRKDIEVSPLL